MSEKKKFGKFLALATAAGAVAAGVSYFLKYRSFHKELDQDFHDFENEDDDDLTALFLTSPKPLPALM